VTTFGPPGITITSVVNSAGTVSATIAADCGATTGTNYVTLMVQDSAYGRTFATLTVNVTANPPPTLGTYSPGPLTAGQPAKIYPSAAPADNVSVTVTAAASAGFTGSIAADSTTGVLSVANPNAGSYTITVTATDNCGATMTRSFTLTVNTAFGAPQGFSATAISTSQVAMSWSAVPQATQYDILRSANGVYGSIATTSATTFTDTGRSPNTTYVYEVCGHVGSFFGCSSPDAATTIMFTDDPLTAATVMKSVHITELRTAVNAMRAAGGLGPMSFTDTPLVGGNTIRAKHVAELRSGLDAARIAIGLIALTYTDPAITPGLTAIKAAHIRELRNGVK
jgi:hypothetical protein